MLENITHLNITHTLIPYVHIISWYSNTSNLRSVFDEKERYYTVIISLGGGKSIGLTKQKSFQIQINNNNLSYKTTNCIHNNNNNISICFTMFMTTTMQWKSLTDVSSRFFYGQYYFIGLNSIFVRAYFSCFQFKQLFQSDESSRKIKQYTLFVPCYL